MSAFTRSAFALSALAALALPLAACGGAEDDTEYQADVEDLSGGEIQLREPVPGEVPVELPKTEMTNVPQEDMPAEAEGEAAPE
jgi:hypothetical protein